MRVRITLEIEVKEPTDETAELIANEIVSSIDDNYESVTVTESVCLN